MPDSKATRRAVMQALGAGGLVTAIGMARKAHAFPPLRAGMGRGIVGSNPRDFPLLTSSAFTYLGSFSIPSTISSVDFTYSGTGLAVDHGTSSGAYPDGVMYWAKASSFDTVRVAVPTRAQIISGASTPYNATVIGTPVAIPWSGGAGATERQGGFLPYAGQLIYTQADTYQNGGQSATQGVMSLDMSSITSMLPSNPTYGMRHVNSILSTIPTQWQALFGGPCFAGSCVENTYQDCSMGVSLYVFDPANVTGAVNPIPMSLALDYLFVSGGVGTYSKSLGGQTPANGWTSADATSVSCASGGTSLTVNTMSGTSLIQVGAIGTGFLIAGGSESTDTATGLPVGATILSQQSGTTGGAGVYTMSAPSTGAVTNGYCAFGSADNGYCRPTDEQYSGPIFPSNSRTIAFIGEHGTGALAYKNPLDRSGGWGATTYVRRCLMFDANDLLSVMAGTKNPWDVLPYTTFDIPAPSGSSMAASSVNFSGVWYDDTPLNGNPSRFYMSDGASTPTCYVFEVTH